ncbi:MAG: type II toxin-antitoxin system Phd/YefM family antitoxin [Methylococcus sp.]|nr:type II toxin-antitoxin system Phd/YefM family antitoxin [Methylococcus sp.]
MSTVNLLETKTHLSKLVEQLESGQEREIIIARNGKPAARLVRIGDKPPTEKRLGIAKGAFTVPDDIDADNAAIAKHFGRALV